MGRVSFSIGKEFALNQKELELFKNNILKKRQEVLSSLGTLEVIKNEQEQEIGNSRFASHPADLGSYATTIESRSYFSARNKKYLHHLEDALLRLEKGEYGVCIICGKKISKERLKAVPVTRHCMPCKSKSE